MMQIVLCQMIESANPVKQRHVDRYPYCCVQCRAPKSVTQENKSEQFKMKMF